MTRTHTSIRMLFTLLSILFMVAFQIGTHEGVTFPLILRGVLSGVLVAGALVLIEFLLRRFSLRTFNTLILGLFFGYLLGVALLFIFDALLEIAQAPLQTENIEMIKTLLFLATTYLGVQLTAKASHDVSVSIPFIRFSPSQQKVKDFLIDRSAISDGRILDLAATGILDARCVLPRFVIEELLKQETSSDEAQQAKARLALEIIKKLEAIPTLNLRYHETDFPEIKEGGQKTVKLARLLDADIISCEMSRVESLPLEGIRIINLHSLSHALKPLMQKGENMLIKIQRLGKEDRQGVGYLEDGTMVVVNGGGDFLGNTIAANVLSVKHTSSGRMIFCNVAE